MNMARMTSINVKPAACCRRPAGSNGRAKCARRADNVRCQSSRSPCRQDAGSTLGAPAACCRRLAGRNGCAKCARRADTIRCQFSRSPCRQDAGSTLGAPAACCRRPAGRNGRAKCARRADNVRCQFSRSPCRQDAGSTLHAPARTGAWLNHVRRFRMSVRRFKFRFFRGRAHRTRPDKLRQTVRQGRILVPNDHFHLS